MSYQVELAQRVLNAFATLHPFVEKKMFGGLGIMVNGNMCVGIIKNNLVVRVGKENYLQALQCEGTREFNFTGKALTGWVYVGEECLLDEQQLNTWLKQALDFVLTLPLK